jgi:sugar/nucleoside kinase (ribokinase family)
MAALQAAKSVGALISLDLASFTVVEASKMILKNIVNEFVDILIANEDEAQAFTGYSDDIKAIGVLAQNTMIAALKVGKRGSYISHQGKTIKIEPIGDGGVLDTTGAGDLWASGFLFGLVNGYSFEKCGKLGSACGYEVARVIGANIPEAGWQRIKILLEE